MYFTSARRISITLLLIAASLTGCFEEEVRINVRQPVPGPIAVQGLRRVAIVPMEGPTGEAIASALHQELRQNTHWIVTSPVRVRQALVFRRLDAQKAQPQHWGQLARDLHVDALIFGAVDNEATHSHFETAQDKGAGSTTYRHHVDTTLEAHFWAVDRQGKDLGAFSVDASRGRELAGVRSAVGLHRASDKISHILFADAMTSQLLMAPAARRLASQCVDALKPRKVPAEVVLYTDSSRDRAQHALVLARANFWGEAAAVYQRDLHRVDEAGICASARVYYNLGVCLGQGGNILQARIVLEQARTRGRYCMFLESRVDDVLRALDQVEPAVAQAEIVGWLQQDI